LGYRRDIAGIGTEIHLDLLRRCRSSNNEDGCSGERRDQNIPHWVSLLFTAIRFSGTSVRRTDPVIRSDRADVASYLFGIVCIATPRCPITLGGIVARAHPCPPAPPRRVLGGSRLRWGTGRCPSSRRCGSLPTSFAAWIDYRERLRPSVRR